MPIAIDFATVIRSGATPKCSIAKKRPVRANPLCTSSQTMTIPCSSQIARTPSTNSCVAGMKPPSPCTGSNTIAATSSAATSVLNAPRMRVDVVERDAVHLGRERAEAFLVRPRLRGEREREVGAAVEGALEADHGRAAGVRARELDRVLDRLGAGVEEGRLRRPAERREREQALGQRRVDLVRDDREVGVREALELLLRGLDDVRMRMADVQTADAAREIDERVAVDVRQRGATRLGGGDREGDRKRRRHARCGAARGSPATAGRGSRSSARLCVWSPWRRA